MGFIQMGRAGEEQVTRDQSDEEKGWEETGGKRIKGRGKRMGGKRGGKTPKDRGEEKVVGDIIIG